MAQKLSIINKLQKTQYLKYLAVFYLLGFFFLVFNLFIKREDLAQMIPVVQVWMIGTPLLYFLTTLSLFCKKNVGIILFHAVAFAQLIAYFGWQELFGRQDIWIVFHILSLMFYWKIIAQEKKVLLDQQHKI